MPSPYLTYALAALSFGLAIAFFRISDENATLSSAQIAMEMKLETAQGEAKSFREKYSTEVKAREFAEAAQTIAETSERTVRSQLMHETKALEEAQAAISSTQEQLRNANAQLLEAGLLKEASEAQKPNGQDALKDPDARGSDATPDNAPTSGTDRPAQASMAGTQRSWFSFWGLF